MVHRTPFFLPWVYPTLIWRIPTDDKTLYLTFDDGPVPGPTEFVLETLKKFHAKATFFCIGENIEKHDRVFQEIIRDGHGIGNHTFNHMDGWKTSTSDYEKNVARCQEQIEAHSAGLTGKLFRPPYGKISREQIRLLSAYKIVMWDVLSIDYNKNLPAEKCLKNSIQATRKGSIIIFHDSYKAEKNLTFALPRFIEHYAGLGFAFKSIH